jgi:hypothetical protein
MVMKKYLVAALIALAVAGGVVAYTSSQQPAELHACGGDNNC